AMNEERAAKLIEPLKLKPGIIHNNRLLKVAPCGVVDMEALKSGKREPYAGDTETPEQHIPATGLGDHDWEACMTINHTWGFKSDDHEWKSTKVLLQNLIDIASKGGNYLLNVGPTAEGLIPQASVERLEEIGKWMDANGESIYGTGASPFPKLPWGRCTTKKHDGGTTLYLHVFDWPTDGKLLLPGLENQVQSAQMLVGGAELKYEKTPNGVVVDLPAQAPDANASVIKMEIVGKPKVVQLFIKPAADGSIVLPAALVDFGIPAKGSSPSLQISKDGPEIGGWNNPEAPVSWSFSGLQPGDYEVLAEVSGPDNAKATVELGAAAPILNVDVSGIKKDKPAGENEVEKLPASLKATGSYHKYEVQNLGTLEIEESGEKTLTLRPDPTDWKPFNLRQVTLQPIAEEE
ncbi:MAG: alpha-L-fucosidase, partial [Spartobacteria bacterium]